MVERIIGGYAYRDKDELGRGAFARVYSAEKHGQGDKVAMKLFSREARDSFTRERDIYLTIKDLSNHILHYIDDGEEDGQSYLIFQQAQEETLRDQLNQVSGKPFGTERALAILRQIGGALIAIHDEKNIVHGDIRPENIFFDKNNQALLADFGMAVLLPSGVEKVSELSLQGDPLYMAPEQLENGGLLAKKCDQYSLGCVAYELFTGRHPLGLVTSLLPESQKESKEFIGHRVNAVTIYDNPCKYNKLLPQHIAYAIMRTLEKNPEKRFENVRGFIDELIKAPAVIGYGLRYPTKPGLETLDMPKEGCFGSLTRFLEDQAKNLKEKYTIELRTTKTGRKLRYIYVVPPSGDARNLLYIPAEFVINSDRDHCDEFFRVMRPFYHLGEPTLIFYDSFEVPAFEIIESCDKETYPAGLWFISMKYIYELGISDEGDPKRQVERIWEMTKAPIKEKQGDKKRE